MPALRPSCDGDVVLQTLSSKVVVMGRKTRTAVHSAGGMMLARSAADRRATLGQLELRAGICSHGSHAEG